MKNQVQLIAYVDRFSGGGLRDLQDLLKGPFAGLFGGIHLLPFSGQSMVLTEASTRLTTQRLIHASAPGTTFEP